MVTKNLGHITVVSKHRRLYKRYVRLIKAEHKKPNPDKKKIARWSELSGRHIGAIGGILR